MTPPSLFLKIQCFSPQITQKSATKCFGLEMIPPPSSEVFQKFIEFGTGNAPLVQGVCLVYANSTLAWPLPKLLET